MNTIIITGGAGFIGTLLTQALISKGYRVFVLDRVPSKIQDINVRSHVCDLTTDTLPVEIFENVYAIINLAGTPIFGRFTKKYKNSIYDSRIKTLKNMYETVALLAKKPQKLISASAVGYYGNTTNPVDETTSPGNDFLATVCIDWESHAQKYTALGLGVSIVRTANVIGKGGLFLVLKKLFKNYIGGYFGNGMQYIPWVSATDLVNAYIFLLESPVSGTYNVASGNMTQKELMHSIASATYHTPVWSIPRIFGYILYSGFVDVLLMSIQVSHAKITDQGFVFQDTSLKTYLEKIEAQ